jgi:hypothetical protein
MAKNDGLKTKLLTYTTSENSSDVQLFLEGTIVPDYWLKAVLLEVPGLFVTISILYNLLEMFIKSN